MKIPYTHKKYGPNGAILRGPKQGINRYYLDSLYNSLLELRPKLCLEIGTHFGGSSIVFQDYFDEYMPDGLLITCDIKKYTDLSHMKNVRFVQVHAHINNMKTHHMVRDDELLPKTEYSMHDNAVLIYNVADGKKLDFVYIDGDHQAISFDNDLDIARCCKKQNAWILVDDTSEEYHELAKHFQKFRNNPKWEVYDFNDWEVLTGTSLLRENII